MGSYAQALQHKQALSDQELEGKIGELVQNRKDIQGKLPLLLDDKGQPTPQYQEAIDALTKNAQALRQIYHPDKNPTAIQNFGHLLTDALHLTKPEDRIQKEAAKRTAATAGDEQTARAEAAAAPVPPEQEAIRQYHAQTLAKLKDIDSSDLSPEDKAESKRRLFGIADKPALKLYQLPDGTKAWLDASRPDLIPPGSTAYGAENAFTQKMNDYQDAVKKGFKGTFEQWEAQNAKPSTAQFNERLAAYAKDHGTTIDALPEAAFKFIRESMAREAAVASSNTNTTFKQDASGQLIPVTETNYRNPGGGQALVDPLGPVQSSSQGGVVQSSTTPTQTPKGAGQKITTPPKSGATPKPKAAAAAAAGGGAGNVKVGEPIMQGRTPAISKAQQDVVEAKKLDSLADQVSKHPEEAINQKRLAVQLERVSAGRFTTQALDYVIKSGWGNTIQQWVNNPTTGALPNDIVKQLVDGAHENLKASKDALQEAIKGSGSTDSGQGDSDINAIVNALNGKPKAQ